MSISAKWLLQSSSQMNRIKYSLNELVQLIFVLIASIIVSPSSTNAAEVIDSSKSLDPTRLSLIRRPVAEKVISPGEARLMTQELNGLIDRFKATLLTADAIQSNVDLSTESVIREARANAIARKQDNKATNSKYQASHLALHQASLGLQKFNYLVKQRQYNAARNEWSNAQKTLWSNYPQDKQLAPSEVRAMWFESRHNCQSQIKRRPDRNF